MPNNGAQDVNVIRIALDAVLTDLPVDIGTNQIVVGRMDANFLLAFKPGGYRATVDRPLTVSDCERPIDKIFITTTAALAGGVIELWTSNVTNTGFNT